MFEIPEKFEFLRNRIEKTLKPTNEIKYISCKTKPWESKLGGCPYLLNKEENLPFSHECKIIFKSSEMAVTDYEEAFEEMIEEIDDEDENEFYEAFSSGASRIGGYPVFVQNPVEAYESGSKPVLLLQLDEDPIADIMFGDCGNCQFFISEDDLRKKDFSDIVYDWVCC